MEEKRRIYGRNYEEPTGRAMITKGFQLAGFDKKEFFTHRAIMDYGNAASHVTKRPMIMKKQ